MAAIQDRRTWQGSIKSIQNECREWLSGPGEYDYFVQSMKNISSIPKNGKKLGKG